MTNHQLTRTPRGLRLLSFMCMSAAVLTGARTSTAQPAAEPRGTGFTLELGMGAAYSRWTLQSEHGTNWAPTFPSLGLGWFVTNRAALVFRLSGIRDSSLFAVGAQYFFHPRVMVAAGVGGTMHDGALTPEDSPGPHTGVGVSVRVGYSLLSSGAYDLRAALEYIASTSNTISARSAIAALEWQWL